MKYEEPKNESQMVSEPTLAYNVRTAPVFSGYQMQILDSIAGVKDENDLIEIRNLIAEYFSNKALDAMDKLCNEGKLSDEVIIPSGETSCLGSIACVLQMTF